MSESSLTNVVVHGVIFREDDDEILDVFNRAKTVELPEEIDSHIVNISEDDPDNSAIIYSSGLPKDSFIKKGSVELLALSVDDDGDITVSVDLSPELLDLGVEFFDLILEECEVHVDDFGLDFEISRAFSELTITVDGPESFDYHGVRFSANSDYSFIVQSSNANPWLSDSKLALEDSEKEDESTSEEEEITEVSANSYEHFDVNSGGEFIQSRVDEVREYVEELMP